MDITFKYKKMRAEDLSDDWLKGFVRHQIVSKCWRKEGENLVIKDDPFVDDWNDSQRLNEINLQRDIIKNGGCTYACYVGDELAGFASLDVRRFGSHNQYFLLEDMFISEPWRRYGIGSRLFELICDAAKAEFSGADCPPEAAPETKLYISAHSAVESVAFYMHLGCMPATEINEQIAAREPFDCPLEFHLC